MPESAKNDGAFPGAEARSGPPGGPASARPKRGETVALDITSIDHRGLGLGTLGEFAVAVRSANPGARVEARILGRKGPERYEAALLRTLEPGPHAAPARCPHAGVCGGCALPRLAYDEQLRQKHALVAETLRVAYREAELDGAEDLVRAMPPVLAATRLEGYRNKMDFTFGSKRYIVAGEPEAVDSSFGLGLHVPRFHQKVLDIEHCAIAFEGASEILRTVRSLAIERGLPPWDLRTHSGLLRHLVLRKGMRTGEVMVDLVTSERGQELIDPLVATLVERHPWITTVVQNVTERKSSVALGEEEIVLHGPGTIDEILAGRRFRISADSFFQTNTEQAERLFDVVAEFAEVGEGATLFDLYCGAGTIGLTIGAQAERIVGFESAPSAVRDARANAARNGVTNVHYHDGDVLETMAHAADERRPDVVVVDPPRAGLHPRVPPKVAALGAPRIVVVSCNPRTGARDVAALVREGYAVERIQPVDLFPHTPHVEVVFGLVRSR